MITDWLQKRTNHEANSPNSPLGDSEETGDDVEEHVGCAHSPKRTATGCSTSSKQSSYGNGVAARK